MFLFILIQFARQYLSADNTYSTHKERESTLEKNIFSKKVHKYIEFCYLCTNYNHKMTLTESIIQEFKAGKLEQFYKEAYPSLLTYATRILSDGYAFLAEDCVQECIYKSYEERDKITDPISWRSFLYAAVHNKAVSILRQNKAQHRYLELSQVAQEEDFSLTMIEQEMLDQLFHAINQLPEKYQHLFELSFEQGLSNTEVAQALGLSLSGMKKQKSKMLEMLRKNISKEAMLLLTAVPAMA